ncbi:MAG: M24 family metallopeptidase [bacterium]
MKNDLDKLMKNNGVGAIIAMGSASSDPIMYYLLNGINVNVWYIKKYKGPAHIIHSSIEREEAMKTGLKCMSFDKYNIRKIYEKYKERVKANAILLKTILDDFKIDGCIALYGNMPLSAGYHLVKQLKKIDKKIEILYEPEKNLITKARMTKSWDEIKRIKKVRNGVITAFNNTIKWVSKMRVKGGIIYKEGNRKLVIGDLKNSIAHELFKAGFINSAGLIIAQARDAGIPHNAGKNNEPVRIGKTIVFDIFPQEIGGGYYFDFTRTICFGYAPRNIEKEYEQVKMAQNIAFENLHIGRRTIDIERAVCKYFEKNGHQTLLTNPLAQTGYCHSLGHGLGLNVHESPSFGLLKNNQDRIEKGMVFTVEPGVYYPEKGYGIRLEDVVYIDEKGKVLNLTNYPRNLVVEL